ncbi:MAG: VCBS repeat-containing protein, partial [bacterium]
MSKGELTSQCRGEQEQIHVFANLSNCRRAGEEIVGRKENHRSRCAVDIMARVERLRLFALIFALSLFAAFPLAGDALGSPTFNAPVYYSTQGWYGNPQPINVVAADYDNDGDLDLAVANFVEENVLIRFNNGGLFNTETSILSDGIPVAVAGGDIDNDGDIDLVVLNRIPCSVSVFRWTGSTWATRQDYPVSGSGSSSAMTLADFNNDGFLDLAVTLASYYSDLVVIPNAGNGTFSTQQSIYEAGNHPSDIVAADFDGDGRMDLAVNNSSTNIINVIAYFNTGVVNNWFPNRTNLSTGGVYAPVNCITAADFNGDGHPDLAVGSSANADNVHVFRYAGSRTFAAPVAYDAFPGQHVAIKAFDFDGDGDPDLASFASGYNNSYAPTFSVFENLGSGTFSSRTDFSTLLDWNDYGTAMTVGDLDGDGDVDIAVSVQNSPDIPNNRQLAVFMNTTPQSSGTGDVIFKINSGGEGMIGRKNRLEVWIKNSVPIHSMTLGFEVSLVGVGDFRFEPNYGSHGYVNEEFAVLDAFDPAGLNVIAQVDNVSPETFRISGASPAGGIPASSSYQLCYTLEFELPRGLGSWADNIAVSALPAYWSFGTFTPTFHNADVALALPIQFCTYYPDPN